MNAKNLFRVRFEIIAAPIYVTEINKKHEGFSQKMSGKLLKAISTWLMPKSYKLITVLCKL